MNKFGLTAAVLAAGALFWSSSANANMITINGAQIPPGFPPLNVLLSAGSPASLPATSCCDLLNTFIVQADAEGTPNLPLGQFDSDSLVVQTTGPGTLILWFTETGLTAPLGPVSWQSSLTTNSLTGGITSVTLSTFLSPTDGVSPPNGVLLDTFLFTGIGTQVLTSTMNPGPGPYSLQEVYTINASGFGSANLTIDLVSTPVPESASLALVGSALACLGLLRRRRTTA